MHHRAAGGAVLAGSDTFLSVPGLSLQRELVFFVDMGIPPLEAIRIATLDNAAFIGLDAELGSVEPGKRADLVVLDADPLADIANIASVAAVYRNGEPVDLRYHADHSVPTPRPPMVRPLWVERRLLDEGYRFVHPTFATDPRVDDHDACCSEPGSTSGRPPADSGHLVSVFAARDRSVWSPTFSTSGTTVTDPWSGTGSSAVWSRLFALKWSVIDRRDGSGRRTAAIGHSASQTAIWSPTFSISRTTVTRSTFSGVTRWIRAAWAPDSRPRPPRSRRRPEPVAAARPHRPQDCRRDVTVARPD